MNPIKKPATPPRRLDTNVDSAAFCALFDVYLNGAKQRRCTVADVDNKYVTRFKANVFGAPIVERAQPAGYFNHRIIAKTENVCGNVQIVWKGEPPHDN